MSWCWTHLKDFLIWVRIESQINQYLLLDLWFIQRLKTQSFSKDSFDFRLLVQFADVTLFHNFWIFYGFIISHVGVGVCHNTAYHRWIFCSSPVKSGNRAITANIIWSPQFLSQTSESEKNICGIHIQTRSRHYLHYHQKLIYSVINSKMSTCPPCIYFWFFIYKIAPRPIMRNTKPPPPKKTIKYAQKNLLNSKSAAF